MNIFVTSDLHLSHSNIIKYCNRPFKNVEYMDRVIVKNWNRTVKKNDSVYFIGDLSFHTEYWIPKLNGKITFIKGNHDRFKYTHYFDKFVLKYKDEYFMLIHNPKDIPESWKSWSICGHHHNNYPEQFPFFDKENKRFNVSIEMTKYHPVNIDYIYRLIKKPWWKFW